MILSLQAAHPVLRRIEWLHLLSTGWLTGGYARAAAVSRALSFLP